MSFRHSNIFDSYVPSNYRAIQTIHLNKQSSLSLLFSFRFKYSSGLSHNVFLVTLLAVSYAIYFNITTVYVFPSACAHPWSMFPLHFVHTLTQKLIHHISWSVRALEEHSWFIHDEIPKPHPCAWDTASKQYTLIIFKISSYVQ